MTDNHEHVPEVTGVDVDGTPVLRCNRCGKPITPETAVLTPTGYRCQDCIRQQQKVFDTTKGLDVLIGSYLSLAVGLCPDWAFLPF